MEDVLNIPNVIMFLSRKQRSAIKSLGKAKFPLSFKAFDREHSIQLLYDKGLVEIDNGYVMLSALGQSVFKYLHDIAEQAKLVETSPKTPSMSREERIRKSNEFQELHKQGLSYRKIAAQYGIHRNRVKQVLESNADCRCYLREHQELKVAADEKQQKQQQEQNIQKLHSNSLATLYPERVAELWDYERNGKLRPEEILASSKKYLIWLQCSKGHSWNKKPYDITFIWKRNGTSGCPACAGRIKKSEKQPFLTDIYSEILEQYWDYKKNSDIGLYPEKLTLSSNKKAWFRCPDDGNEWQVAICSTVSQQWSKGKSGCKICNGTSERKIGEWKRSNSIAVDFPDLVDRYWLYEVNNKLELDSTKLTCGSRKKAVFKCPIDGYEWSAAIIAILKGSWRKGNSGCPACSGLIAIETTSLIFIYSNYVAKYWDYEKNNEIDIYPDKVTKGSNKEVWLKCPEDGHQWKTRICNITSIWNLGKSGCVTCLR